MSYNHILVAVDFAQESLKIIEKAIKLAKPLGAKISLIHVDGKFEDDAEFGGLIDTELAGLGPAKPTEKELIEKLDSMLTGIDYPISQKIIAEGGLCQKLVIAAKTNNVDLIVMGHHHDFWSKINPSSSELLNNSQVDILIVPLNA
ncbi:universal stress protein [Psychromonas sp. PT13]|uniref:universal stress protein n=1 Tax=Psychromonas sp. PT13 TaxID=3439547 RepID=UPI003EB82679